MAREHAQIFVRVWGDPDWRARTTAEQQLYFLLVSQPQMNFAGVLPLQPRKWASCSADGGQQVQDALAGLRQNRYVVVDEDTEEVLVRTFIRNSEVYRIPGVLKAALAAAEAAQSQTIRAALAEELGRLPSLEGKTAAEMTARIAATRAALRPIGEPIRERSPKPIGNESGNPSGNRSFVGPKEPIGEPMAEPIGEPSITVPVTRSSAVDTVSDLEKGIVQEADARADAVPDTAPAPLEDPDPEDDERAYDAFIAAAQQRAKTTPLVASPIEGAMPPARCRNHLELPDPPPCGRCADARRAQDAWIADRDAKVAKARADVQAEVAEDRRLERAAIADCPRCDDRGINAHGSVCRHTAADEKIGPGKAAANLEREKLRQRLAAKGRPDDRTPHRASSEQLAKIAILFGDAERDDRLTELSRILGREITTMTGLTRAEASVVIDHFEAPPTPDVPAADDHVVDTPTVDDPPADEEPLAYSPEALYDDADAMEAAVREAREQSAQPDDDTEPEPTGDPEFEDEYRTDQQTWTTDAEPYAYAGGPDDGIPF